MIGIIGGIGSMAGLNLAARIVHFTTAAKDQDHLPMILFSRPAEVGDRTEFLLGRIPLNPGYALARQILDLEKAGATVVGMACNTAHAVPILGVIQRELDCNQSTIRFVNVINETIQTMKEMLPEATRVGILGTTGTYLTGLYRDPLIEAGFEVVDPGREIQDEWIHKSIYDPLFGIKSTGTDIRPEVTRLLQQTVAHFRSVEVGAFLYGCSEMDLAMGKVDTKNIPLIKPMDILARALIREYTKTEVIKKA